MSLTLKAWRLPIFQNPKLFPKNESANERLSSDDFPVDTICIFLGIFSFFAFKVETFRGDF